MTLIKIGMHQISCIFLTYLATLCHFPMLTMYMHAAIHCFMYVTICMLHVCCGGCLMLICIMSLCICCSTICSFGTIFSELVQNILNWYNFKCTGLFLSTV